MAYDRRLLLAGAKRNQILELWEVQRYGSDCYDDADYVRIYGMPPAEWYSKDIRLLGRTAVECTRDALGAAIGADVAAQAARVSNVSGTLVVDPFAGSGNTLYWLLRHLPGARGLGFESDANVFQQTRQNLAALNWPVDIQNTDYRVGLSGLDDIADRLLVVFIAPPWGDALDATSGLDLGRTTPPIVEIVDLLTQRFPKSPLLCAIQVYEKVNDASMAEVQRRFDWSASRNYVLNAPGQNHGVLIGAKGIDS
jgi:hypothetical protein